MKQIGLTLAMLLCQSSYALAAEHQGTVIDGQTVLAQVYSYETGASYDARVQFSGDQVSIEFLEGGRFLARLRQSNIQDLSNIEVFGRPWLIPLTNFLSIGLDYRSTHDGSSLTPSDQLRNFWRISIDPTQLSL